MVVLVVVVVEGEVEVEVEVEAEAEAEVDMEVEVEVEAVVELEVEVVVVVVVVVVVLVLVLVLVAIPGAWSTQCRNLQNPQPSAPPRPTTQPPSVCCECSVIDLTGKGEMTISELFRTLHKVLARAGRVPNKSKKLFKEASPSSLTRSGRTTMATLPLYNMLEPKVVGANFTRRKPANSTGEAT